MKNKTHLFYGIIIGILLTLCLGMTKEEQKNFEEIRNVIWYSSTPNNGASGFYEGSITGSAPLVLVLRSQSLSPNILHKAGWTIIDWGGDTGRHGRYLIGK
jgi:hypothetical protein